MKTTTAIVTGLTAASIVAAAPTADNDAAPKKRDAATGPSEDWVARIRVEREEPPTPVLRREPVMSSDGGLNSTIMKTSTLVTTLAIVSVATAAPTPTTPDASLERKDAGPDASSEDSFTHTLVERDGPNPVERGDSYAVPGAVGGPPVPCYTKLPGTDYCPPHCRQQ
ncbi:uncharacterized protein LOC62_02G002860 [Vanrija pseudolonga]|uniref:Uncharacterized protein n=1 Tax=Vanrija pseudolonga TaxID=143232 RepID=A0AAF0Y7V5_9TREE|nr:hypothetical protein LOC62_02G002860 [Vanrija pseudolonga]